jgi:putative nucleotidyltransferase with HDIG domain
VEIVKAEALRGLPPFPWIVTKLLQLFSAPVEDLEVGKLVALIRADASFASELLRCANSPLYGLQARVASVDHAVTILGLNQVKSLALTVGLGAYLGAALRIAVLRRCWRHSVATALLAEELAAPCGLPAEQAYTAGLLHDIGRLALLAAHPQRYADLLSQPPADAGAFAAQERELFGMDHSAAGAWLAREWGFPKELARAVSAEEGEPEEARFGLLHLIHVSCGLAAGLGFDASEEAAPEQAAELLAKLPSRAAYRLRGDLSGWREDLTRRVNALE